MLDFMKRKTLAKHAKASVELVLHLIYARPANKAQII
jgi:hypothetical protein